MTDTSSNPDYGWDELIKEVCKSVGELTGNVFNEKQRPMVESRMKRRLMDLHLATPGDYKKYWLKNKAEENSCLVGILTTHFTSFFREFSHFEWLATELPQIIKSARADGRTTIKIWSAACSKGQEVWSLCMWLQHYVPKIDPQMNWHILGTDIDSKSVEEAENGVYHRKEIETAPRHLWEGLWSKGKDEIVDWYRIKKEVRPHVKFASMNLLAMNLSASEKFDVIICRNVLIYFDRANQLKVVNSLLNHLSGDGALITGMSESLNGFGLDIRGVHPSIYKKSSSSKTIVESPVIVPKQVSLPQILKVFCIDDSATVLTILKKILKTPDFEIIGTAANGAEAIEALKTLKPDAITLDLHMPIMDGPTFLRTSGVARDIPVIVVSSVGRSDNEMVDPLFKLGVIDFVEKPTLQNMIEIGEELGQKLKMGWQTKKNNITVTSETLKAPAKKRQNSHIIFNVGLSDEANLVKVLKEKDWANDEITILINSGNAAHVHLSSISMPLLTKAKKVSVVDDPSKISGTLSLFWLHFKFGNEKFINSYRKKDEFLVTEESTALSTSLRDSANDISPITSFSYLIDKLIGGL